MHLGNTYRREIALALKSLENVYLDSIIIIIIIFILIIPCTYGIYNYIPQSSHVPTLYTVAAVLYLHSVLHVMLFLP